MLIIKSSDKLTEEIIKDWIRLVWGKISYFITIQISRW